MIANTIAPPATYYLTKAAAESVAARCQADDPEWTYVVASRPRGFVIVISDEDGIVLGML